MTVAYPFHGPAQVGGPYLPRGTRLCPTPVVVRLKRQGASLLPLGHCWDSSAHPQGEEGAGDKRTGLLRNCWPA